MNRFPVPSPSQSPGAVAAPERALVVRLSSIGDVVHTLPAFMTLREAWPETELGWAVEPAAAELLRRLPGRLRVHVVDLPAWKRRWWAPETASALLTTRRRLGAAGYELALDFQGLLKSAVVARWSGAPVVGLHPSELREPLAARLYDRTADPLPPGRHVVERGLRLAAAVGAEPATTRFPELANDADRARVADRLGTLGVSGFATLHAVANWPSKRWPSSRWVELGRQLHRRAGLEVLWLWGPGERQRVAAWAGAAGAGNRMAPPTDLPQLAALLERADVHVGGDSAPLHLAVAVGAPVVGLFGPTDPARNGPLSGLDRSVARRLPCSFCFARRCPLGTVQCLREVPVAKVLDAVLARRAAGRRGDRAGLGDPTAAGRDGVRPA